MSARISANPDTLIGYAASQLGYSENPPSSNQTKYGAWYGLNYNPWCAMFDSYCSAKSGNPLPPIRTSKGYAYVPDLWNYAKWMGQLRRPSGYNPKPGDRVMFSFGGRRPDHVGIVIENLGGGRVLTIEGNTNGAGSRTGGSVLKKVRKSNIIGYASIDVKTTGGAPPVNQEKSQLEVDMYIAVDGVGFFAQVGNVTIPLEGIDMAGFAKLANGPKSVPTMVLPRAVANDFIKKAMSQTIKATGG